MYTGVWLSVVFVAWVVLANRVPFLEPLAQQRNAIATLLLALIAACRFLRFLRSPEGIALISGLLAWGVFAVAYRILSSKFILLQVYCSTFTIFGPRRRRLSAFLQPLLDWYVVWRTRAAQDTHTLR